MNPFYNVPHYFPTTSMHCAQNVLRFCCCCNFGAKVSIELEKLEAKSKMAADKGYVKWKSDDGLETLLENLISQMSIRAKQDQESVSYQLYDLRYPDSTMEIMICNTKQDVEVGLHQAVECGTFRRKANNRNWLLRVLDLVISDWGLHLLTWKNLMQCHA